jgi:hypothetical protein
MKSTILENGNLVNVFNWGYAAMSRWSEREDICSKLLRKEAFDGFWKQSQCSAPRSGQLGSHGE